MKFAHLHTLSALFLGLFVAFSPSLAMAKGGKKKRRVKRYHLTLHNVNTKEKVNNLWVIRTDPKNKNRQWVGKRARKRLTHFLRDWRTGRSKHVPERLLWYLYLIGQRYDAPIEIVSGYRHKERRTSRHKQGRAVDIRIKGVSNKALWRYCKRFNRVGLGYYPNSKFVHLDVRKKSYYWIDDSGPGEESRYRSRVGQPKDKKGKKRKKGVTAGRSGKGSKAKAKQTKVSAAQAKSKSKSAPATDTQKKVEKRALVTAEDAPSAGPKPVRAPKVAPPTKSRTVKAPLTRPVRPTAKVRPPTVTAPKVPAPKISRPSKKTKKVESDPAKKKTAPKAKTPPPKKTSVNSEDVPAEKKPAKKSDGK